MSKYYICPSCGKDKADIRKPGHYCQACKKIQTAVVFIPRFIAIRPGGFRNE